MTSEICRVYKTFGTCLFGENCLSVHPGSVPTQEFFFAILDDEPKHKTSVTKSSGTELFYIPDGGWFRGNANASDLVLFQASGDNNDIQSGRLRYGRIVAVLKPSANEGVLEYCPDILNTTIEEVYTLDPERTRRFDNAYSVEKCSDHKNCEKIGLHVALASLANPFKIKANEIPSYESEWKRTSPKYDNFNLQEGHEVPTLSVYVHTGMQDITAPKINVVRVKRNFLFGNRTHNDEFMDQHFDILWKHFVGDEIPPDYRQNRSLHKYVTLYSGHWKEYHLLNKMTACFMAAIKTSFGQTALFITKVWNETSVSNSEQGRVTIFADLFRRSEEGRVLMVTAAGLRFEELSESMPSLLPKYRWTAESFSDGRSDNVVPCTAPFRKIRHYVNQQIALHRLLNSGDQLYKKEDLLGILGIRFQTPHLQIAFVARVGSDAVEFEYPGLGNTPDTIYEAPISIFADEVNADADEVPILIQGIHCREDAYCNRDIVHLILDFINGNTDADPTRNKVTSPYETHKDGTTLILQAGIQLQIQISIQDARRNNPLKWRLLRIGKNCHMCFTHFNNPELAFKSDREDVQEIVTSQQIQNLLRRRPRRHGVTVPNVRMDWNDAYYSGGSFNISRSSPEVNIGTLLCIRKEISPGEKEELHGEEVQQHNEGKQNGQESEPSDQGVDPNTSEVDYVWCCHGVVSAKEGKNVKFQVCTLSQTEAIETEEVRETDARIVQRASGFWVEVIDSSDD